MSGMEQCSGNLPSNPLKPAVQLKDPGETSSLDKSVHPQQIPTIEDSAVTKAEKFERHGVEDAMEESPAKRIKLENGEQAYSNHQESTEGLPSKTIKDETNLDNRDRGLTKSERQKGVAPIKKE